MTPNFAVVAVETPTFHMPRLWVPLFLLVLAAVAIFTRTTIWRLIALCWGIVSALPGTDVRVTAEGTHVLVRVL
jgi:hypothetical protein